MAKPLATTGIPEVTHMLLMVFRSSLEREVLALLRDLRVKAFTDLPEVLGAGRAQHGLSIPLRVFAVPCVQAI